MVNPQFPYGIVYRIGDHGEIIYMGRVILEDKIGRPLEKNEAINYVNGDMYDNQRHNLKVGVLPLNYVPVSRVN